MVLVPSWAKRIMEMILDLKSRKRNGRPCVFHYRIRYTGIDRYR
jgi:hypothetical protein